MMTLTLDEILKNLAAYKNLVFNDARAALIAVMALHIIASALAWHFWGRSMWSAFSYPIVAAVIMANYVAVFTTLIGVPGAIGDNIYQHAWLDYWDELSRLIAVVATAHVPIWKARVTALIAAGAAITSALAGIVAVEAIRVLGYVVIGILYIMGPLAVVAMAFRGTAIWGIRWAVTCVEVGCWKIVLGVILSVNAAAMSKVTATTLDVTLTDPASWMALAELIGVLFVSALAVISTPVITRALIGGGAAFAMSAAASMPAKQAVSAGGSAATGAVAGAAMGGPLGAAVGAASGAMSSAGIRGVDLHAVFGGSASSGAKAQAAESGGGDSGGGDSGGDSSSSDSGAQAAA